MRRRQVGTLSGGGLRGGGSVSVTTALAVLPTNRPMAASKLTDHSSDAES